MGDYDGNALGLNNLQIRKKEKKSFFKEKEFIGHRLFHAAGRELI